MYLTERKLFFSVNHVFSGLTGRREEEDFSWFASYVPAFEIRNGQMWPEANASADTVGGAAGEDWAWRKRCAHDCGSRPDVYGSARRARPWMSFSRDCERDAGLFMECTGATRS